MDGHASVRPARLPPLIDLTQVRKALLGSWTGWNRESLWSVGVVSLLFSLVLDAKIWVALHLLGRDPDY